MENEYFFCQVCDEDGFTEFLGFTGITVESFGGPVGMELALATHYYRYRPLGSAVFKQELPVDAGGDFDTSHPNVKPLIDAWVEKGRPWLDGMPSEMSPVCPWGVPDSNELTEPEDADSQTAIGKEVR